MEDKILIASSVILFFNELLDDEEAIRIHHNRIATLALLLRNERQKSKEFYEKSIPGYLPDTFKRFFRMSRQTYEFLCQHLSTCPELPPRPYPAGRHEIPFDKKVLMFLKYFASQETVFEISDRFNVTEYTFLKHKSRIISAITNNLLHKFIVWPDVQEQQIIADAFNDMGMHPFPNVIAAVDGSHISIEAPFENPQAYYNRKKFYSLILQGVCQENLQFIDIYVGWPGRVHDANVLKHSHLWETGDAKCQHGHFHILGDGAYPLRRWLLTPYRNIGNLPYNKVHYNISLSSKRQVIERAFGLLKGRFRRLKHLNMRNIADACSAIVSACVLHNICIMSKEDVEEFMDVDNNIAGQVQPAIAQVEQNAEGVLKRTAITNQLAIDM